MANSVTREIRRILNNMVQFGGFSGFQLKNNSVVAQFRNATDAAWADVEVKEIRLHGPNSTFKATITIPTLAADATITLPVGGMSTNVLTAFNQATTTIVLDANPPANGTLDEITIAVDVAASGGSPTLKIEFAAGATLVATTEVSLKEVGLYKFDPFLDLGATPADIQAVVVASAQTFSGRILLRYIL